MTKKIKIAGVVTLFNPTDQDISNINTYIDDIDRLYVMDNTEGRNNEDRLPKNEKIQYFYKNENLGVATTLNIGAEKAVKEGYQFLLTMDQDTTFNPGVMDKLKKVMITHDLSDVGIITPWHHTKLLDSRPKEEFDDPHDVMTSGNILNLDIYQKIGGFKDWLFIDGIDIEYCMNIHKHGYKILRVNSVEIDHNLGDIFYKKIRNRLFLCTNHAAFRRYYIMRNYHYIHDLYKDYDLDYCSRLINQRHNIVGVILFEKKKCAKVIQYIKGYRDYKKGIRGKKPE